MESGVEIKDEYQERYLAHQEKKKCLLSGGSDPAMIEYSQDEKDAALKVIKNRRSRRIFKDKVYCLDELKEIIKYAPSSCNRRAIYVKTLDIDIAYKLVGGKGWCEKGTVYGLFGKREAYKSPYEQKFMPYLDAGVIVELIYLWCEMQGYKCCFINPNTHDEYNPEDYFCGAIAIGK